MNVKTLIRKLKKMPQSKEVCFFSHDDEYIYKLDLYKNGVGIKKAIPNIQKKFRVLSSIRSSKKEQLSSLNLAR